MGPELAGARRAPGSRRASDGAGSADRADHAGLRAELPDRDDDDEDERPDISELPRLKPPPRNGTARRGAMTRLCGTSAGRIAFMASATSASSHARRRAPRRASASTDPLVYPRELGRAPPRARRCGTSISTTSRMRPGRRDRTTMRCAEAQRLGEVVGDVGRPSPFSASTARAGRPSAARGSARRARRAARPSAASPGSTDQRAGDADALAHAAGELARQRLRGTPRGSMRASTSSTRRRSRAGRARGAPSGSATLPATSRHGSSAKSWNTKVSGLSESGGRRAARQHARPRWARGCRRGCASSVDLPQPDGPISATISPLVDLEVDRLEHDDLAVAMRDVIDHKIHDRLLGLRKWLFGSSRPRAQRSGPAALGDQKVSTKLVSTRFSIEASWGTRFSDLNHSSWSSMLATFSFAFSLMRIAPARIAGSASASGRSV